MAAIITSHSGLGLEISLGGGSSSFVSRSFALSRRLSYFPYLFLTYDVLGADLTQRGEALRVHARRFASVKKRLHTRVIVRIATPWQTNASSFSKAQPLRMCRPEWGQQTELKKMGSIKFRVFTFEKRVALFDGSADGFERGKFHPPFLNRWNLRTVILIRRPSFAVSDF